MSSTPLDLQIIINDNSKVFGEIPKGLLPTQDHDHDIHLQLESVPPKIRPYRYPYAQKSDIEHTIQEMLEIDINHPIQSNFSSQVVMVMKKDGSWHMCPNYKQLNLMTIKDKFFVLVNDELLDYLHGDIVFSKLDIHSGYHHIRMRKEDFPK
jgi:hypothetical protein